MLSVIVLCDTVKLIVIMLKLKIVLSAITLIDTIKLIILSVVMLNVQIVLSDTIKLIVLSVFMLNIFMVSVAVPRVQILTN